MYKQDPIKRIRRHMLVLRLWQDDTGRTWGYISEPLPGWKVTFASLEELFQALDQCMKPKDGISEEVEQ